MASVNIKNCKFRTRCLVAVIVTILERRSHEATHVVARRAQLVIKHRLCHLRVRRQPNLSTDDTLIRSRLAGSAVSIVAHKESALVADDGSWQAATPARVPPASLVRKKSLMRMQRKPL